MKLIFLSVMVLMACNVPATTDTINDDIAAACSAQEEYILPTGRTYLYSAINITTNCKISGSGPDFGTVLIPVNVSAFVINGDTVKGGWAFRDTLRGFTIDGSETSSDLIVINKAYTTKIIDVFVYNQESKNGITVNDSNHIQINSVVMYGKNKAGKYGIRISGKSTVVLNDVDIENYFRCVRTEGLSTTDFHSPYMERCVVNIEHATTGRGSVNVFGGFLKSSNGYNVGLFGNNFNLHSTKLESYKGKDLSGKVVHCFNQKYLNVKMSGIARYEGYLRNTNCPRNIFK